MRRFALLRSGALGLELLEELIPLVTPWRPLNASETNESAQAIICVDQIGDPLTRDEPFLHLATVAASVAEQDVIALHGMSGAHGAIRLGELRADLVVPDDSPSVAADVHSMLTLSAAFLLGRMHHALVQASAAVDPEGRAWLLVGDAHTGDTSTVNTLIEAGWSYLADDQVVVSRSESGEVIVEGWPRVAPLSGQLVTSAPLGGTILPTVRTTDATAADGAYPATVFNALVRQSPWLIADAHTAPAITSLLTSVAELRLVAAPS
jgi:hypothetical protein